MKKKIIGLNNFKADHAHKEKEMHVINLNKFADLAILKTNNSQKNKRVNLPYGEIKVNYFF